MERTKILELALQALQEQKAGIEADIAALESELNGTGTAIRALPSAPQGRAKSVANRSEKMKQYWAAKRAGKQIAESKPASASRRKRTIAEKKAMSLKMKEAWKRRKAAAAGKGAGK